MKPLANILLVEDDQAMLEGMDDLLQSADMAFDLRVRTAENGLIGLEKMADPPPDLIVSDIMMPQMDGYQFLHKVRENPDWIHIPFIFLTARGEKQDIREGRLSGADLYLVKPFRSDELLALIESQLSKSFRRQESRQQDVDKLKRDILQILNHEFRTPLTYVTAYYEMLTDGLSQLSGQSNLHEYLRGIQNGCFRLSGLVNDLIRVIELRTGEAKEDFARRAAPLYDVDRVVKEAIDTYRESAAAEGIDIHFQPAESLPAVFADAQSLQEALERIIDNAVKFSHTRTHMGKLVTVTTEAIDCEVHISVEDEGVGFPPRIRQQIFELFFQYNRDVLEQQGTGIGLTIAKGLLDLHHGRIEVESQENKGSKFTIVLPSYSGKFTTTNDANRTHKRATILVVEDDIHLLEGLQELLEISTEVYHYTVFTADNGIAALKVLEDNRPDLIISDIMMPEMGGYDFLREVRQNPEWLQIPFIFLTAKGERHEIHSGLLSGVEAYVTKPYDSDELLELVASKLGRYFQVQGALTQNFNALKRNILTLITPDFRLPLSSVTRYSEDLAKGFQQAQTEEELKVSLHGIQESSIRLAQLVEDFISMAELQTGEAATAWELNARPLNHIGAMLRETAQIWAVNEAPADMQIEVEAAEKLPPVYGDRKTLSDCLFRLLNAGVNRFRLNVDNRLSLSACYDQGAVKLKVRFAGKPDERMIVMIRQALSSPADRGIDSSPESSPDLIIVKGYVALHKGSTHFDCDDNGCCFVISLPVYEPPSGDNNQPT